MTPETSQVGHTPGPWIIDPKSHWDKEIGIEQKADGWKRFRCEVDYDDCDPETAEANARLIAAAPELLEALIKLDQALDFSEPGSDDKPWEMEDWSFLNEAFELARAALHKAQDSRNEALNR